MDSLKSGKLFHRACHTCKSIPEIKLYHFIPGTVSRILYHTADQSAFLDRQMRWKVEKGEIDVEIGSSSEDIRLKGTYRITEDRWIDGAKRAFYAKVQKDKV